MNSTTTSFWLSLEVKAVAPPDMTETATRLLGCG
jgi:hypothetical protein